MRGKTASKSIIRNLGFGGLAVLTILILVAAGCSLRAAKSPAAGQKTDSDPQPAKTQTVTLYFSDSQAMFLQPETREVTPGTKEPAQVVVEELIKGPLSPDLQVTVPKEARLLSVQVADKVATLDFSKEFQTKHWGGSTGEMMTLYSITNSLCELEGIEKVQFLLEGEKLESILGHMETMEPLAPNLELVKE